MTSVSRRHAGRGFTLVELMVAVAIGLFLVAAIGGVFVSSKRSFWATNAITTMDDTARAVFDLMGTSIRQAGFNGCQRMVGSVNGDTRAVAYDPAAGWWTKVGTPVQAYVAPAVDGNFAASVATPVQGTEVLRLIGVDPTREASVISDDPDSATITTGNHPFQNGQTLLATSCLFNSFFTMTGGTATTITYTAAGGNCSANLAAAACDDVAGAEADAASALPVGASILPVVATVWFVAPSSAAGKGNSLWGGSTGLQTRPEAAATELVNGVENLAFEFGVDTIGDGSSLQWQTTDSVPDWNLVRAVRVHLLLSTLPDSGASAVGDNATVRFNDQDYTSSTTPAIDPRRVYREYTAIFTLRNKM